MAPFCSVRYVMVVLDAMNGIERSSGFIQPPPHFQRKRVNLLWVNMQRAITDAFDFNEG
jgi:hypothetical protein